MNEITKSTDKFDFIIRRWGKEKPPNRKFTIWGFDKENNPCLMILFGIHELENKNVSITNDNIEEYHASLESSLKPEINPGTYFLLKKNVKFIGYTILNGQSGHFPPFIDLKLMSYEEYKRSGYYYRRRPEESTLIKQEYYLTNQKGYFTSMSSSKKWVRSTKLKEASPFYYLPDSRKLEFPYFDDLTYEESINLISKELPGLAGFKMVDNPNDVLQIDSKSSKYLDFFIEFLSNQNLYQRKKALQDLIESSPPKVIYLKILEIGSIDLISGLFLQLAKCVNPILKEEAEELKLSNIDWATHQQVQGLKRCIQIYLTSINPTLKSQRVQQINEISSNIALIAESGRIIRSRKRRDRWRYELLMTQEKGTSYDEFVNSWSNFEWQAIGPSLSFKPNNFTDGKKLFSSLIKNTIQEAEIYKLPEIIGKIGAWLDSIKVYYLAKSQSGFLTFIKRYIRRIILEYFSSDEEALILALKSFFMNYRKSYFLLSESRYGHGNSVNHHQLLYYFLFNQFEVVGRLEDRHHYYYSSRRPKIRGKNFKQDRMENKSKEIISLWKDRLLDVIDIAVASDMEHILNFCLKILNDNIDEVYKIIKASQVVSLSLSSNRRLSELFKNRLEVLLEKKQFDSELMLALMGSKSIDLQEKSWEYYERTGGKFSVDAILDIIFLDNLDLWVQFFGNRISELKPNDLYPFYSGVLNRVPRISETQLVLPEGFINYLNKVLERLYELQSTEKAELFNIALETFRSDIIIPAWCLNYLQNFMFSLSDKELTQYVDKIKIDYDEFQADEKRNCVYYLLKAFKTAKIPSEKGIVDILSYGAPRTVQKFVDFIEKNKNQLKNESSKMLLLFESDLTPLNSIAASVFESLKPPQFKEILSTLIDSPEKRVQSYVMRILDENYGDMIPKEFLIQMLEHGSPDIKAFISDKVERVIESLGNGDASLFVYYIKTLLFLPNYKSKSKDRIYDLMPLFTLKHKDKFLEIEDILLELGGSNIIKDSERALVSLALIKKEGL